MKVMRHSALAITLFLTPAVFAETYIVPDGDCGAVTLRVTNAGESISADRVANAYVSLPHQRLTPKLSPAGRSLTFDANVPNPTRVKNGAVEGVVMAGVDLKQKVNGNETRTEHAKALIFCGTETPVADWQRSVGLGFEIYPQSWNGPRPRLKAGDTMRFIAVDKATRKLIMDVPMDLYTANGDLVAHGVRAEYGGMNFLYQQPGRYMVVSTYRRADPQQTGHWLVDTSTLTFDIK